MRGQPVALTVSYLSFAKSTFLRRELERLPDGGVYPLLFYLRRPGAEEFASAEFARFRGEVHHSPYLLSAAVLSSQLLCLLSRPRAYVGTLLRLVAACWHRPRILLQTVAIFPKSVHYGRVARRLGCKRVHGLWATSSATAALIAARTSNLAFSFTGHAWDIYAETTLLPLKVDEADFVLTCTRYNVRHLVERYAPRAGDKIVLNYHGLPLEQFSPAAPPTEPEPLILSVGRRATKKGFHVLVEACRILRESGRRFRCQIVGEAADRPYEQRLRARIGELGLDGRIELVDHLPELGVRERMARAAVVVQPSVVQKDSSRDGIPNVLIEAMALGRPVVSTTISGIPELVDSGENGLLVPPDDAEALAAAVERVLASATFSCSLGAQARRKVEALFDLDKTCRQLARRLLDAK